MGNRQKKSVWNREQIIHDHISLLNQEKGGIELKKGTLVKAVCVFPNKYSVGMANIGFQTVYRFFNSHPEMSCERGFYEKEHQGGSVLSFETSTPLNKFNLIGFSISFELDIINLIKILVLSKIPLLCSDRTDYDPIILAGGPVTGLNPSPVLPFVDGFLVGDGEDAFNQIGDVMADAREHKLSRLEILDALSKIQGMFVHGKTETVKRQVLSDLNRHPSFTSIITPKSHFKNLFVTEVSRGCPRNCRFCAAREIYKPFRYRSIDTILSTIDQFNPRAERIGLEGSAVSDYPRLANLCEQILDKGLDISFSSIRADKISYEMEKVIKRSRLRTFTMAPEAGSERLRNIIGKQISDDEILKSTERLVKTNVRALKLYYMIGLPEERDKDIEEIGNLTDKISKIFNGQGRQIRISVNTFIPKPFTPFECEPVIREKEITRKRNIIRNIIGKRSNIVITGKSARDEVLQSLLSLGSKEIGMAVMDSVLQNIPWKESFKRRKISFEERIFFKRDCYAPKEWDMIV